MTQVVLLVLAHVGGFDLLVPAFVLLIEAKEGFFFAEEVFHEQIRCGALMLDRGQVQIEFLPGQSLALRSVFFARRWEGWTFFN